MEDAETLLKKLAERYDKNPVGWKALAVFDKGSTLLIIMSPEGEVYEVKMVPLDPYRFVGVGTMASDIEELYAYLSKLPNYGFRPLPDNIFKAILKSRGYVSAKLAKKILEIPTVSINEIQGSAIAQGPIICFGEKDLASISPKQRELQERLSREVEKLFCKRYRDRAMLYG
ncbi:MAG: hypothetical protein DRJ33_01555 [Candidatus Methanomethylicota archaeon]|uniref:Uncharacterized protein n=1 Tax=Thermoproteota archaeon TaxID=2056631 RepID=A0A497F2W6_9CREN|nr:MAG: hypothetical protein DRJ33_01555 [Candidatus Verstraetearchaeota archaeon]